MNVDELNSYAITALLRLANEQYVVRSEKIYQLNADIKFVMKDGKVEALDVLNMRLAEKCEHTSVVETKDE